MTRIARKSSGRWVEPGIVLLIVLLAVFLRFFRLNSLPPGLFPDEAANGLDVFRILEKHDWRPLYATNGPREALFFYLQAIFVKLLGNTILALRMAPALIGSLAVFVSYLWAKSWFGARVALITAFLMAVSPWAITMSRIGFRASMIPLFIPLVLWLYTRAIKSGKKLDFLIAGFFLGLGMYTYLSFRLFPLVFIVAIIGLAIWRPKFLKRWYRLLGLSLVACIIALLPMIIFGLMPGNAGDVLGARSSTSFMNPELNHGKPLETLLDTIGKTALMFNFIGDKNYRHNLGGAPMLLPIVGVLFLLGLALCAWKLNRPRYLTLLATFGVMLLPEVLTAEGIPHGLRAIGAMPAVFVIAAIAASFLVDKSALLGNKARQALAYLGVVVLLFVGYQGYRQYFVVWANDPETYEAYSEDDVEMARFLNQNNFNGPRYGLIHGFGNITVLYLTHNKSNYTRIDPGDIDRLTGGPAQFVVDSGFRAEALDKLQRRYQLSSAKVYRSKHTNKDLFWVYEVK